jgi:hypothetical protein
MSEEITARVVMALIKEATSGMYGPTDVRVADMAKAIWFLLYAESSDLNI